MCAGSGDDTVRAPEVELAKLIKDSLDIDVQPGILRLFIKAEWDAIARAAHAIHGRGAGRIRPGIKTADGPRGEHRPWGVYPLPSVPADTNIWNDRHNGDAHR